MDETNISSIIDQFPGGMAIIEAAYKTKAIYYNKEILQIIGYDAEEFIQKFKSDIQKLVLGEDIKTIVPKFRKMRVGEGVLEVEFRIIRSDGTIGWLRCQARKVPGDLGKQRFHCLFTDITHQKKLEIQVAKQRQTADKQLNFLNTLYKTLPCTILQCTCEHKPTLININRVGYEMMGFQSESALIKSERRALMASVYPEDQSMLVAVIDGVLNASCEGNFEVRLVSRENQMIWVTGSMNIILRPEGQKVIQIVCMDETESKNQEIALHDKQKELEIAYTKLQLAFESSAMKMWEYDIKNQRIHFLKGKDQEAIQRWVDDDDVDAIDHFIQEQKDLMDRVRAGQSPVEATLRLGDDSGHSTWQKIRYISLFDDDGEPWTAIGLARDVSDEVEAIQMYHAQREQAQYEVLTGLLNRKAFKEYVDAVLNESDTRDIKAFYVLDIDDFKAINDSFGHDAGDKALCYVANQLTQIFGSMDYVARLGGDEFVAFSTQVQTEYLALEQGMRICDNMEEWPMGNDEVTLSVSVGLAIAPQHGSTFETLYQNADRALYDAKIKGKDMCQLYQPELMK